MSDLSDPIDGCRCVACRKRRGEDVTILWGDDA